MAGTVTGFDLIHAVVRAIPRGRVMTYGAVAQAAGFTRGARLAGRALHAAGDLPWHRVVGRRRPGVAHITIRDPATHDLQRALLEAEGVRFDPRGGIDLARYGAAAAPLPRRIAPARRGRS